MNEPNFNYDRESDTLYISFEPNVKATGIALNDHILLRIDKAKRKAVGLTFFDYSILTQQTNIGPRSFPLTGLNDSIRCTERYGCRYSSTLTHQRNPSAIGLYAICH